MEAICRQLLVEIGEDPQRPGLWDTPRRWARWWREFTQYQPGTLGTTFESLRVDQMVVVRGMRVWSLCEHHLLPFWCDISVGYIPQRKVLGLSKFARIAHRAAHRLQIQERLVDEVAQEISLIAQTPHVAVLGSGQHLCMTMRGIRTPADMISSALLGCFRSDPAVRAEFLGLVDGR